MVLNKGRNKIKSAPQFPYIVKKYIAVVVIAMLVFFSFSCTPNSSPPQPNPNALFAALSPESTGIDFANHLEETEEFNIIEYLYFYNGGGVATGDLNNDGLPDIYFTANQLPNKLYLNKGNFQFEDITEEAGLASPGAWKTGVTMVDINGDGFLDIYVCRLGNYKGIAGKNELYINNGDLTFTESAAEYGLDFQGFSTQAAFFDYDGDGDLDMYLLNHAVHTERSYGRASLRYLDGGLSGDRLYRNNADKGEKMFSPVTNEAGIYSSHIGYGLGIGISDLNNDGLPDIYVSNDFNENDYLYINQGNGSFREQIKSSISYSSRFSMGNDLADFNNDGWTDIISLDMLPEDEITQKLSAGDDPYEIYRLKLNFGYERQATRNMLQLNSGNGTFSEIGQYSGVNASDWSWAPLFADYDNDGHKDLFIANGIVRRPNDMDYINFITGNDPENPEAKIEISNLELASKMPPGMVNNYFFRNNGDLRFENVSTAWGMTEATASNGSVYVDLDNDGDLDLVVNNINQTAGIFKNHLMEKKHMEGKAYLKIKLQGKSANRFGIGSKVIAFAGDLQVSQENYTSRGFQSSVAPELHLGLGSTQTLDSLLVIWPGGKSQTLRSQATNQTLILKETDATDNYSYSKEESPTLLEPIELADYGLIFDHLEDDYNDFNLEPLLPHKMSREGPAVAVGDINGDGLEDIFVGGAHSQAATIFLHQVGGNFRQIPAPAIASDSLFEDVSAVFFDSNNNGHQDLYVVSAGNIPSAQSQVPQDRLYLNDGKGNFTKSKTNTLPGHHSSVVLAHDYDGDGWIDLFIGGRVVPGNYGEATRSYLLRNQGDGDFLDVTASTAPDLHYAGMVKSAVWTDINRDGESDLVLAGEWMPVTIFIQENGKLVNRTSAYQLDKTLGWWNSIQAEDLTGDGFPDLIAGNLGLNSRLKASESDPVKMYVKDFDDNGSRDQIITQSLNGKSYTLATKDELVKKIPSLKKQFTRHSDFAGKTVEEIFKTHGLEDAALFQANEFHSAVFINEAGKSFRQQNLPPEAQLAPIYAIFTEDLNGDGCTDLILGGNQADSSPYFGAYQGSRGLVLIGDCNGNFESLAATSGGVNSQGNIRHIESLALGQEKLLIVVKNDGVLEGYRLKKE